MNDGQKLSRLVRTKRGLWMAVSDSSSGFHIGVEADTPEAANAALAQAIERWRQIGARPDPVADRDPDPASYVS